MKKDSMNTRILVVEDESDIRDLLLHHLVKEGFSAHGFSNAEAALAHIRANSCDLLLLDLMLPGISGLELCRILKHELGVEFPIVMVTARGSESDIVAGLEMGADDYVVKPFSVPVLMARVRKALGRVKRDQAVPASLTQVPAHGIQWDEKRHEVKVDGERIDLTSSEFSLLKFLASHPGWVYTRSQIVRAVHGENYPVTDRSVDVLVLSLRRKLGSRGSCIETVRGVGYRFGES